ncbi:hypothetical protein ccbrp13_56010 [Ktedonobacteria bacterium brp13]|nr:hypothetical protein ccbrp13_56010 [Ktedonobacteria bacterium brp13]
MSESVHGLTTEEAELVQHLATGKSHEETARLMNISSRTIKRWLTRPHVAESLLAVKQDVATHVREQIKALSTKAIQALEDSLALEDSPSVRLKAAQLVLDRVAPEQVQSDQPLQGQEGPISKRLLQYLTNEELAQIEHLATLAEQRAQQAEQDRETLERKRM